MKVTLLLTAVLAWGAAALPQAGNGSIEGRATLLGSSEGIDNVQVTLEGPLSPTLDGRYTPNPALTAAMRAEIDALIASSRFGATLEILALNAVRLEMQLLGLPEPPRVAPPTRTLPPQFSTVSDGSGNFSFKGLAPGRYRIRALREGYFGVPLPGGISFPSDTTAVVTLESGKPSTDVALALTRSAVVSGTVRGFAGQTLPAITVRAYRVVYQDSSAILQSALGNTQSNDRGEYRFINLAPGEYYLVAFIGNPSGAPTPRDAFVTTFHPRSVDTRTAKRIAVNGADVTGIDIEVQPRPAAIISGRVNNFPSIGINGQALTPSTFFLLPTDPGVLLDNALPFSSSAADRSGGKFEIRGVVPGSYYLMSCTNDNTDRLFEGRTRIDVGAGDVRDVVINMQPGTEVRVRLTVDGAAPPFTMGTPPPRFRDSPPPQGQPLVPRPSIQLSLRSLETYAGILRLGLPNACRTGANSVQGDQMLFDANGLYTFQNIAAGSFDMQMTGLPPNAYVADMRIGSDAIVDGFKVGTQPVEIQMTVNSNGSTIEGTVRDAGQKAFASALVALVPAQGRRQNSTLYKSIVSDASGRFTLKGVAPGEYTLFAWETVSSNAWMNPEFLATYEGRGQRITVSPGPATSVDLQVIR